MTQFGIAMGLVHLACATVCIVVSVPLMKGYVKMNGWYGIRIKKAFKSDENWYKINAYGGKRFIIWSLLLVITGVASFFIPVDPERGKDAEKLLAGLLLAAPALVMIPPIIEIMLYSRKL